ncbi:MAG: transcriptional regulator, ArsR family [Chloroflexi bacterium]|nr:transcriptional regulator, ArsR family [Chloroflexota bacterium]
MATELRSNQRVRPATRTLEATALARPHGVPHGVPDGAAKPTVAPMVMERAARVIRVLGHPLRLRLLEALEAGERNVTDLVAASGASQALVSQHLASLRAEGVVGFRRDGPRVYYRITEPKVHRILDCIRDCDMPELAEGRDWAELDLTREA